MTRDFGEEIKQMRSSGDLVGVINKLKSEGWEINDFPIIRLILEGLGIDADLPTGVIIDKLKALEGVEIDPDKFLAGAEKQLEQGVVPTAQIRELLEEYERHLESGEIEQTALSKLLEQYSGRISKRRVEELIKRQQEIYQQAVGELTQRKAVEKLGEEGVRETAEEMAKEVVVLESRTEGQIPPDIRDHVIKEIRENVLKATVEQLLEHNFQPGELETRIRERIKELEPEKIRLIVQEVEEIPLATEFSLGVNEATNEIVDGLIIRLRSPDQLGELLVEENRNELEKALRIEVRKVMLGKKVEAKKLAEVIEEKCGQKLKIMDSSTTTAIKAAENFRRDNPRVTETVAGRDLEETIEARIIAKMPRDQDWPGNIGKIKEYTLIIRRVTTPRIEFERYRGEAKPTSGAEEEAWNNLRGLYTVLKMRPGEFNQMVERYWQARTEVKTLPYEVEEVRITEEIMELGRVPEVRNLINLSQRAMGIYDGFNNLIGGFSKRFGVEELGNRFLGRIGGQVASEFFQNSVTTLAQNGFKEGALSIFKGIIGGGVKVGAVGAAKAGTTGILAAIGGISGPPGWIAAAGVMLLGLGKKILSGLFEKITGIKLPNLGKFLGLGDVFKKGVPGILGKLGTAGLTLAGAVIAIPSVVMALISTAAIGTVVIAVIVGLFIYSMLQSSQISSLVPPRTGGGTELNLVTWDPNKPIPEGCPQGFPVNGGTITQGPHAMGCSHGNIGFSAIDIGLDTGNPIMATHNGVAQAGHNSGYGYFVAIRGKCQGKEFLTVYAHMLNLPFNGEKEVKKGDAIGLVDNTGNSSGPHIHYEIRDLPDRMESYLGLGFSIEGCCEGCPQR